MSNSDFDTFDTGYAAGWAAAWNNENETEAEYSRKEIASLRTELVAYCNQRETDAARIMALQIQMDEAACRNTETIAWLQEALEWERNENKRERSETVDLITRYKADRDAAIAELADVREVLKAVHKKLTDRE